MDVSNALLVLNGTSLNNVNALLALSQRIQDTYRVPVMHLCIDVIQVVFLSRV